MFSAQSIDYTSTGYFSELITDYLSGNDSLIPFYRHKPSIEGIEAVIEEKRQRPVDRQWLVEVLRKQYESLEKSEMVQANITALLDENTFTICTAHQPNIFTGHLYFIYKILHAVKLAATLQKTFAQYRFVPVYYMGSEDADLDELGQVTINGEVYRWNTDQTGAVGRMKVDKALIALIHQMEGQLLVHPYGQEVVGLLKASYKEGVSIERATFQLVHTLFSRYGLIVLLPDNPSLKRKFIPILEKELKEQFSHRAVAATIAAFPGSYKVQANGRALNLFYLKNNTRERIEMADAAKMLEELPCYPERFSPNVILRPVLQEFILPNIAFIGGGGEIAYWLELKRVFEAAEVSFPMLVVRNSFLLIDKESAQLIRKLGFAKEDLFKKELLLVNELVKRSSTHQLQLDKEKEQLQLLYHHLKILATKIDRTLGKHTEALQAQALKKVNALEKKMLSAEKKKFAAQQRQVSKLKQRLFPNNTLQERVDNFLPYYAQYGASFIQALYEHALSLEQQFTILTEN